MARHGPHKQVNACHVVCYCRLSVFAVHKMVIDSLSVCGSVKLEVGVVVLTVAVYHFIYSLMECNYF